MLCLFVHAVAVDNRYLSMCVTLGDVCLLRTRDSNRSSLLTVVFVSLSQMKKFESQMRHEQQMRSNGRKAEMDYLSTNLLSVQVSQDYSRLQSLKPLDSARSMRHTMPAGVLQTVVDRAESRAASCSAEMNLRMSSTISGALPQVVDMNDF